MIRHKAVCLCMCVCMYLCTFVCGQLAFRIIYCPFIARTHEHTPTQFQLYVNSYGIGLLSFCPQIIPHSVPMPGTLMPSPQHARNAIKVSISAQFFILFFLHDQKVGSKWHTPPFLGSLSTAFECIYSDKILW